ncbi:hypothetical protein BDZ88DRAFT_504763 [Geranomyces variabilis]|nr:hypothetical protein BDZ88DRAFT_504763 [Geranomyces variabilis]KAJ3142152.1 hypothetical protein HDU90_004425 [Geranomyces variabilis]
MSLHSALPPCPIPQPPQPPPSTQRYPAGSEPTAVAAAAAAGRPPRPSPPTTTTAAATALALLLLLAAASSPSAVLAQAISCRQAANVCIQNSTTTATLPFDLYAYSGNFAGANIPTNPKQWEVRMYAGDLSADKTPLTNPCAPPSSPLVQTWAGDTLDWEAITPSVSKVTLTIDNSDALRQALAGTGGTQGFFFSVGSVAEGQCTLGPNITPYTHLKVVLPPASSSSVPVASSTAASTTASASSSAAAASSSATHPFAATTPAPADPNVVAQPPPPPQSSSSSSSTSIGMIAGIAVGAAAFIAIIIACLVHRRNRSRKAWGLEHGSRSIGAAGAGGLAAVTAGAAAAAASKNKNNTPGENASLARLVHGSEGQSLRASTPDEGGTMSPDEIRVGSFESRASFDRRNNAEALSLARSSNNPGRSLLPAAAALGVAAGGAAAASSASSTTTTSDVEHGTAASDASPRSTNPFLDPPSIAAAAAAAPIKTSPTTTGTAGQSKNRGSIMATMNQPYRSLPRPSSSDSLSSTEDQDATNPFLPSSSHESDSPLVNPFATAAELPTGGDGKVDHRHRMAQMIANAYRKGLSDEQTHWHMHPTTHAGEGGAGVVGAGGSSGNTAKEVPGLRRVDDGRHASAATLPGLHDEGDI